MSIDFSKIIPQRLRLKWPPLPDWAKQATQDVQSVLSLTPVVLLMGIFVICFFWYDMQNRFTKMGDRIIASQVSIRAALDATRKTEISTQRLEYMLGSAQKNVSLIETDSKKIREALNLSQDALLKSKKDEGRIEEANRTLIANAAVVAQNAAAMQALREKSEESLRQSRENATKLTQSTDEIVRSLMESQHVIDGRLVDIQDRLQKVVDLMEHQAKSDRRK